MDFGITQFWVFLAAGVALNLTPGADTAFILAQSARSRAAGVAAATGITCGALVHTALASVGASAILALSPIAYDLLKLIGGAYLIFIGIMMMRKRPPESAASTVSTSDVRSAFQQGMLTNLLNPKVALFFLAFIPQFVDAGAADARWGIVLLSLTFVATGAAWCIVLAVGASALGSVIKNSAVGRWLQRVCGAFMIALGLRLALSRA